MHKHIPKKLHFTYKNENLPEKYRENLSRWKDLCPDWELHFYSDSAVYQLFEQHFPEYVEELPKIPCGAMLADVFRYAALYVHGGMYSDIDTVPLMRIPDEWLSYEAVIGYEYQVDKFPELLSGLWKYEEIFCQWTFLSSPKNPLFKEALDRAIQKLRSAKFIVEKRVDVLKLTGPLLFSSVAKKYKTNPNFLILDADFFACDPSKHFDLTERREKRPLAKDLFIFP